MLGKKSRWLAPLAATAAVLLTASSASAVIVTRPETPPPITIPAEFSCLTFDLQLSAEGGKITQLEFDNGNLFRVGKGVILTWTNTTSGASYTVNTAGSTGKYTKNANGTYTFRASGHNGFVYFPADRPEGAGAYQYTGLLLLTVDSPQTNNVISVDAIAGQSVDICALLK